MDGTMINGREAGRQGRPVDRAEMFRAVQRIRALVDGIAEDLWTRPQGFGADYSYFELVEAGTTASAMCEALNRHGAEPGDSRGEAFDKAELVACADFWRTA